VAATISVAQIDGQNGFSEIMDRAQVISYVRGGENTVAIRTRGRPGSGAVHAPHRSPPATRAYGPRSATWARTARWTGDAATALWESVVRLPQWQGAPVWLHGDLLPGNLLVRGGRLSAVIDFGGLGVGDPACDLLPAWTLLSPAARDVFRDAAAVDDATWARGRGWALCFGLMAHHFYRVTNPVLAGVGLRAVREALAGATA
jgi:aminoglycoside phosphotransferase (APT) family kinase protein